MPSGRINIYLDDRYLKIWETIPKMQRSKFIRKALKDYAEERS